MVGEGNDTQGLSQRELILILMKDIKEIKQENAKRPTRLEIYGTLGTVALLLTLGQFLIP